VRHAINSENGPAQAGPIRVFREVALIATPRA
jgi:hypothetical protein